MYSPTKESPGVEVPSKIKVSNHGGMILSLEVLKKISKIVRTRLHDPLFTDLRPGPPLQSLLSTTEDHWSVIYRRSFIKFGVSCEWKP